MSFNEKLIMEKELNIAAILKEKPKGTKLWSPISGDCKYEYLIHDSINVWFQGLGVIMLSKKGKWNPCGETIIFPSKQMQDWSKFAWKKGDVLVSNDGKREVLFKTWENDSYTKFVGLHCLIFNDNEEVEYDNGTTVFNTNDFKGIETEDVAQTYINTVEERLGGKLNLETLEIEQPKPEFKDGDIVSIEDDNDYKAIIIYKSNGGCMFRSYALIDNIYNQLGIDKIVNTLGRWIHLATDSEQQQLFSALEKEGKRWNPDTKQIEDLPKKCEFKPMDWCLMRDKKETWKLCQFSFFDDGDYEAPYNAVGGNWFDECIPYNEETAHLLGTTDEWKGGE